MFEGVTHIHFVGIGGIGVSALAKYFFRCGAKVSGSDLQDSELTNELKHMGMQIFSNHATNHVPSDTELLIYSPAVSASNVERMEADIRGIQQLSYPEALGELTKQYSTIAVCGTNGKSTTTAMLGLILTAAGLDPTVIVGAKVLGFSDGNLRMGKGKILVIEACEYRAHFLHLYPEMIVMTNIEADHLDYFRNVDHVREVFQQFVDQIGEKGLVVWNADDLQSRKLQIPHGIAYGFEKKADFMGRDRRIVSGHQEFQMQKMDGKEELGTYILRVLGSFNVMNAIAAATVALKLGVSPEIIRETLEKFSRIWRRFERVGVWKGADVVSDYGHHPTAIANTLTGVHEFFPNKRIVLCFQPHQHARTQTLFTDFVQALSQADILVIPEIYGVAGRTESEIVSSRDLVAEIKKLDPRKPVFYAKDLNEAESILRDLIEEGDLLLIQGAGDVDLLARQFVR